MESRRIERDRSETALRWIAAGLAFAALVLAAACGGKDRTAERVDGPAEVIGMAAAEVPMGRPAIPVETTAMAPAAHAAISVLPPGPEQPPVTYGEAEAAFRGGRYGEAADLFERYVEGRPMNPWGHYMLGLSAWKGGYLELAEAHLLESVLIDPGHVKGRVNLSRVLIELGQPAAAQEHARIAEELDPEDVPAKRTLARALAETGDHEGALAKYEEALWIDPEDRWSLNNMGYLMIQRGRHEDAVGPLALAVRLAGTNATFLNNLGSALEGAGMGGEADTDAIAQAYLEELWGCPGEAVDTTTLPRRPGKDA